eukprot:546884-Rhodomonas_salina.1
MVLLVNRLPRACCYGSNADGAYGATGQKRAGPRRVPARDRWPRHAATGGAERGTEGGYGGGRRVPVREAAGTARDPPGEGARAGRTRVRGAPGSHPARA